MTKFSEIWKKPHFWSIFGAMRIFLKNPALSRLTSRGFLSPCQKLEKTNNSDSWKTPGQT